MRRLRCAALRNGDADLMRPWRRWRAALERRLLRRSPRLAGPSAAPAQRPMTRRGQTFELAPCEPTPHAGNAGHRDMAVCGRALGRLRTIRSESGFGAPAGGGGWVESCLPSKILLASCPCLCLSPDCYRGRMHRGSPWTGSGICSFAGPTYPAGVGFAIRFALRHTDVTLLWESHQRCSRPACTVYAPCQLGGRQMPGSHCEISVREARRRV